MREGPGVDQTLVVPRSVTEFLVSIYIDGGQRRSRRWRTALLLAYAWCLSVYCFTDSGSMLIERHNRRGIDALQDPVRRFMSVHASRQEHAFLGNLIFQIHQREESIVPSVGGSPAYLPMLSGAHSLSRI